MCQKACILAILTQEFAAIHHTLAPFACESLGTRDAASLARGFRDRCLRHPEASHETSKSFLSCISTHVLLRARHTLAMWLLSSDGDFLGGKRIWLRPGTQLGIGRTSNKSKPGQHNLYIEDKSVSRYHLAITVADVAPADTKSIHSRTRVTLKDDSKVGTTLNGGNKFKEDSRTLVKTENAIKLGKWEQTLHIDWQPVTLTFMNFNKKSKGDPLAEQRQLLEGTDVKLITEYASSETTHVVAKKRNTGIGLQALIQQKRLVGYEWVESLAKVVKMDLRDANGEPQCLLQQDFDAHWPSEDHSVPPIGTEPVPRPPEYLKPNPARADVFEDFVFIFLAATRYNDLLPVITSGGGKALLWEVEIGVSHGDELVSYVKEVAGKKDDSEFRLSQQTGNGGVVVVRSADEDDWTKSFKQSVAEELEQECIKQNEFLDVVLTADASGLRRPVIRNGLVVSHNGMQSPASPQPVADQQDQRMDDVEETPAREQPTSTVQAAAEEPAPDEAPSQPTAMKRNWRNRVKTKPAFDDFDPSQFTRPLSVSPEPSMREPSQAPSVQAMDVDPSQPAGTQRQTQQSSRKRPAPTQDPEPEEEDLMDTLLTGQAALKRRKTEAARKGEKNSFAKSFTDADRLATEKAAEKAIKKQKAEKQLDVKAALAERRKAEDERRRKDEEALREQLANTNIEDIEVQVEEMDLPVRDRPARRGETAEGHGDRWDPAWTGRKNFKKFRRQGSQRDGPRARQVIVQLEEAVPSTRNENYYLEPAEPRSGPPGGGRYGKGKGKSQSKSQQFQPQQTQTLRSRSQHRDDQDADTLDFRRRIQRSREEDAEDDVVADTQMEGEGVAGTARDPGLRALAEQSQTLGSESQRRAAGKRPAGALGVGVGAGGPPPAKKARQTRLPNGNGPQGGCEGGGGGG